jgi:hypothetical protein
LAPDDGAEPEAAVFRRLCRVTLAVPLLAVGIGATSSVARLGPAAPLCTEASTLYRVALVVEHGDGQAIRRCVGFDTSTATALAVLDASGLEVGTSSYGVLGSAICQIDSEPASYPPGCFTGSGSYWVLFVSRAGGAWLNSPIGVSNLSVGDGDAVGFRYDPQAGADPPPPSPAGTCPVMTPPPARTPTPPARATPPAPVSSSRPAVAAPGAATHSATVAPTAGVLGLATPGPSARAIASLRGTGDPSGINPGLLLAAVGAGALAGLLMVGSIRRRRE